MDSPARASLEALWSRAGQAGALRLEIETVRVAEQERALEEARHHLQQWDSLVRRCGSLTSFSDMQQFLAAGSSRRHLVEGPASTCSSSGVPLRLPHPFL